MKFGIIFIPLLVMSLTSNATAEELTSGAFPFGQIELRGYPMEVSEDGTFRIYSGATTFVEGTFEKDGSRISFTDLGGQYACRGKRMNPGSYYWTVHDHGLYLMLIKDNCTARRTAFLEGPLKID